MPVCYNLFSIQKFDLKKTTIAFCCFIICNFGCKNKSTSTFPQHGSDSAFRPAIVLTDSGWISMIHGNTLSDWHTYGKKEAGKAWDVEDSSIHLKPGIKNGYQTSGGGDLVSNDTFSNFDLKLEWKIAKKANSGILVYVQEDTLKYRETWNTGPEMQVCDKDSNEDAHSYRHEAGDLYDLVASRVMSAKPAMEWNSVEIVSNHGQLDLYLNEVHIISIALWNSAWKKLISESKFKEMPGFGLFESGHIALQDHGEEVWYRDIQVKKF